MVKFFDIWWDENFVYAVAEDSAEKGIRRKVKVSKKEEVFFIEGNITKGNIVKALWWLQERFEKGKIPENRELTVYWG